jgi:hypothetical protein
MKIQKVSENAANFYRALTSPIRQMPDFLIIGAQKGGTTSLYYYLVEHPAIGQSSTKEVHYFENQYQRGLWWYKAHFPTIVEKYYVESRYKETFITGEASPSYLFHPHAPARAAKLLPDAKLIVLLRNPVDRAYSQFRHNVGLGFEKLSFEDAIASQEERTKSEKEKLLAHEYHPSYTYKRYAYLERGIYADQLESWFKYFPREQILILSSEDFFANPASVYAQTLEFLHVPQRRIAASEQGYKQYNKSKDTIPSHMSPEMRRYLIDYYQPPNVRLYELLGRDFAWDGD